MILLLYKKDELGITEYEIDLDTKIISEITPPGGVIGNVLIFLTENYDKLGDNTIYGLSTGVRNMPIYC